ncbi:MAG: hypothetical protein HQK59_11860 [Deltaproteobacteria bacterium]|nr:hypothetical protein [Deltaproteobacteria bacterium]
MLILNRFGLKVRIIIPMVITIIAFMALSSFMSYRLASKTIEQSLLKQLTLLTGNIHSQLDTWLAGRKNAVATWTQDEALQNALDDSGQVGPVEEKLAAILSNYKTLENIVIVDRTGLTRAAAVNSAKLKGKLQVADREYFKEALNGKTVFSDIIISRDSGNPVFVAAGPMRGKDGIRGVMITIISLSYFNDLFVNPIKMGQTGHAFIFNKAGFVIAHPDKNQILKLNLSQYDFGRDIMSRPEGVLKHAWQGQEMITAFKEYNQLGWKICVGVPLSELLGVVVEGAYINGLITLAAIICSVVIMIVLVNFVIIKPIKTSIAMLQDIAQGRGDLTRQLDLPKINCSEIRKCQKADCPSFGKVTNCWTESGSMALEVKCPRILKGLIKDCTECREVYGRAVVTELDQLSAWFNCFVLRIRQMVRDIVARIDQLKASSGGLITISEEMSQSANEMSRQSDAVASGSEDMQSQMTTMAASAEDVSTNMRAVATAVEELSASITEVSSNTQRAAAETRDTAALADDTGRIMDALNKSSNEINSITQAIVDIAEQTKLLALNATIEAARAGEAGKGFAVVAGEVKELAKQTTDSTESIRSMITQIQGNSTKAVAAINDIINRVKGITDITNTISTAVEQQSTVTSEIAMSTTQAADLSATASKNVSQGARISQNISQSISQVSSAAAVTLQTAVRTKESAGELSRIAAELSDMVSRFKI